MLWFLSVNRAKNGAKNERFCPLFFALFTDDIGFWTDENRKFRGLADEKSAGSLFYICPFLQAKQKNDRWYSSSAQRMKPVFFCVHIQRIEKEERSQYENNHNRRT